MDPNIWYKSYPAGVNQEINPDEYANIIDVFEKSCDEYADLIAFENMGKQFTFAETQKLAKQFAYFLQTKTNLRPGDSIAIQMPNLLQYPIAIFGAFYVGLKIVNINPLYTPDEMKFQLADSEAKAIVILANFGSNLEKIISQTKIETVIVTEIGDMLGGLKGMLVNFVVKKIKKMVPTYNLPQAIPFKNTLTSGNENKIQKADVKLQDIAFLQYTGGTTGISKGAILSHRNIISNLLQVEAWMEHGKIGKRCEIFITALPIYHIFALTCNVLITIKIGAKNILITNPRDMKGFIKELSKHKFSIITGVNTLFNGLLNQPNFKKLDFSNLKFGLAGGMALQEAVVKKWNDITKKPLCEGYGLSETSPVLTINPLNGKDKTGYIGVPLPSTFLKIVDDNDNELPINDVGEICAKGPQVMPAYWKKTEETEKVLKDGWFYTGDMGFLDEDGFFKIVDRKKEMILVSGFNVYPNEVENVISTHEKVFEVGVIGVPDSKSGEVVKAYIVKKDNSLKEEEIISFCKQKLTNYKCPKYVAFTNELPKSNVGKILRRKIKEKDLELNSYS